MLKKRGGVTPYIVIGLVVLLLGSLSIFIISNQQTSSSQHNQGQVTHIKISSLKIRPYVESCLQKKSFDALLQLGYTGYTSQNDSKIEIEKYLKENLHECMDFKFFPEFEIETGEKNPKVEFKDSQVIVNLEWPLKIKQDKLALEIKEFRVSFPLNIEEIYEKIDEVKSNDKSLDISDLLSKELDITLKECKNKNIIYLIEDEEYQSEGVIIPFFFDSPIKELSELFESGDGLKYKLPVKKGKQILRNKEGNKRFIFDTTLNNVISGCYNINKNISHYTFSLIDQNKAIASATTTLGKKIDINEQDNKFTFSSEGDHKGLTLTFNLGETVKELRKDGKKVNYFIQGEYLISENQDLGTYELVDFPCKVLESGKHKLTFVSLNYEEKRFEKHTKNIIEQIKQNEPFNNLSIQYQFEWQNNTCKDLDCEIKSKECVNPGYTLGLIDNPELGVSHSNSLVSSYLADNKDFCTSCSVMYEFGKLLGLEDSEKGMMSLSNSSLKFKTKEFSKAEKEAIMKKLG